jgi:peptide/nickel transport system permease protein
MAATDVERTTSVPAASRRKGLLKDITPSSRFYPLRQLLENRMAVASGLFLLTVVILAVFAPLLTRYDPQMAEPISRLQGPSSDHWMGTDDLGRDVLARALYGARVSLLVGSVVMLIAATFGSIIGLIAAFYHRLDTPIMRVIDGMQAFPSILLAIAIMASLGPSTVNVIVALAFVYTAPISRVVRGAALVTKQQPYVESARAIGARDHQILRRYVFANSLSPLIVQCTFVIAFAIISEASLSFLGAGVPPETPTWGNMLQNGQRLINRAWWLSVFPGVALVLTVLSLNLLGDGLRDALDPRSRER